ncbi:hypothetical protein Tco_1143497 [Tanacetum coccineum]
MYVMTTNISTSLFFCSIIDVPPLPDRVTFWRTRWRCIQHVISSCLNRFQDTLEHPDDDDEGEDDEDGWEVNEEWLMALVTPPLMPVVPAPSAFENLEHAHGVLARKMGNVSDAQLNDGIAIGEIQPRVTTLEGQDKVNNYPCGKVDGLREDVDRLLGLKDQVQTLEYTVHELRKEN